MDFWSHVRSNARSALYSSYDKPFRVSDVSFLTCSFMPELLSSYQKDTLRNTAMEMQGAVWTALPNCCLYDDFPVVSVWDICIHVWLSGQKDPTMFWLSDGKVATHHQKAFYVFCFLVFACGVLIISFLFNNFVYEEPHTPALPLSRSSSSHNPFPNSWVLL